METLLVRLKPYDPRRGYVLRRYTYLGIKFQAGRGWYRVEKAVGDYLRGVHEVPTDSYSPLAFDVCTEEEAKRLEATEHEAAKVTQSASDTLKLMVGRPASGVVTTEDLPKAPTPSAKDEDKDGKRSRRERE